MEAAILFALALVLALLGYLLYRQHRDAPDRAELARLRTRDEDYREATRQLQAMSERLLSLEQEKARLEQDLTHARRDAEQQLKVYADAEERLKKEFENLANRILEDKGKSLTAENRERLGELLKPFQERLEAFRRRVDEIHSRQTEQTASLRTEVENLSRLSTRVSADAENLAKAIKGDAKVQGGWGEIIIERIFEASGLRKGEEYVCQEVLRDEAGNLQRPDFLVFLPEGKAVIVDSKVSLTAFERYCNEEDPGRRAAALAEHLASVRNHVRGLQEKDYTLLLGNRTLDFVILCIPLEAAYQEALKADQKLLYEIAGSRVVVTGPTTLMIALKLVAQIWRREHENRNAERIAVEAGRMHDQVALVVQAMLDAQKKLEAVAGAFSLAMGRLKEQRGNLVARIEKIRRLGAKVNRAIPAEVVDEALQAGQEALPDETDAAEDATEETES